MRLIIRTCRHHLDAQARLHNMARARRLSGIPRLRVAMTPYDVARNRAEILRVVATGNFDLATARMMLWAMDLSAAGIHAEYNLRLRRPRIRATKPNRIYQVPITPLIDKVISKSSRK